MIAESDISKGILARVGQVASVFLLQAELPGYREYVQAVRYRLIPGIW
jgi:hypothetical protein